MIRAITFDYWRTLLWDERGQLEAVRVEALCETLATAGQPRPTDDVLAAHRTCFDTAATAWRYNRQYRVEHLVNHLLELLDVPPEVNLVEAAVSAVDTAGMATPLSATPHLPETLQVLSETGIRLGIVCDVGLTPSRALLRQLESHRLLAFFDHWSFSDDVGAYKPHPAIFEHALKGLGVTAAETAHVGDMRRTDVLGARASGLVSIRYVGVFDDRDDLPDADHVIANHQQLLPLVGVRPASPGQ